MNKRILELAEQAGMVRGGYANTPDKIMTWRESFDNPGSLEKFALLIVQECAHVAWQHTPDTEELEYSHLISNKIKQHFGVEE